MPPRWNAWTHLQSVQFDYERAEDARGAVCVAGSQVHDVKRTGKRDDMCLDNVSWCRPLSDPQKRISDAISA